MDVGIPELVIILLAVLLLFGPGRITNIGKELGNGIREFKQGLEGNPDPTDPESTKVDSTKQ